MQTNNCEGAASLVELLNDDCLECIFKRLPGLQCQLQAARTCQRFQTVMVQLWRRSRQYDTLQLDEWRDMLPEYEDLKYFLQQVRQHIKTVMITDCCLSALLKDLEDLDITYLGSVHSCHYVDGLTDCLPAENDICTLTKLLPNLKQLRITPPISGRYLVNFKHLEELYLYDDLDKQFEIEQQYLDEICLNLKQLRILDIRAFDLISQLDLQKCIEVLQKLEVLKVNLNTLKPVLESVLKLPNLKKLNVLLDNQFDVSQIVNVDTYDPTINELFEFYKIIEIKSDSIIGLAVDTYYMPLTESWDHNLQLHKYKKLQTLAICNWSYRIDMLENFTNMSQLKLLCCRNWPELTDDILLQFIDKCPKLIHLDVSYCKKITKNLLYNALALLQQQQKRQPLIIYYLLSGIEREVENEHAKFWLEQNSFIKLSNEFPPNSERGLSYVDRGFEFEFEIV